MLNYFTSNFYADSAIMYDILSDLYLTTGNERQGTKFFSREKNSNKPQSTKFGWTFRKNMGKGEREYDEEKKLYKTKLMMENPELAEVFKEYSRIYFDLDFSWTEVTINYQPTGVRIKQHLDRVNFGDSKLVAFGDYTGGKTYVESPKDRKFNICDARDQILTFNGSELKHGVTCVTSGERYSLVFYNNKRKSVNKKLIKKN